jgi:hypothetical protein
MELRHGRPRWHYWLVASLIGTALYLAFELGRYQSGFSLLEQRRERAGLRERLSEEQVATEELRRQLAIAETAARIDRETYDEVKRTLGDLQAQIQTQEEELVFYRGIVSPQDGLAGLRIQNVEALPSDGEGRYVLRLVLAQAIVHTRRVAGRVKLSLEGSKDGEPASFDAAELVAGGVDADLPYEFRYFQGLETELSLPTGFEPHQLVIDVWPNDSRADRIHEVFDWAAVMAE